MGADAVARPGLVGFDPPQILERAQEGVQARARILARFLQLAEAHTRRRCGERLEDVDGALGRFDRLVSGAAPRMSSVTMKTLSLILNAISPTDPCPVAATWRIQYSATRLAAM